MNNLYESTSFTSFLASFPKKKLLIQTPDVSPPLHRSWTFYTQKASFQSFRNQNRTKGEGSAPLSPIVQTSATPLIAESTPEQENEDVKHTPEGEKEGLPMSNSSSQIIMEASVSTPILFFAGMYAGAESFFEVLLALSAKGFQVVIADIPIVDSMEELAVQFECFCETLGFEKVHLMGVECGSFAAQYIADKKPALVSSLCLINPFITNEHMVEVNIIPEMVVSLTPGFILKRLVQASLPKYEYREITQQPDVPTDATLSIPAPDKAQDLNVSDLSESGVYNNAAPVVRIVGDRRVAESYDFIHHMLGQVATKALSSRINLFTKKTYTIEPLFLEDEFITIIDTLDQRLLPKSVVEQTHEKYANARFATLKVGGDFPQLGNSEEVIMHVLIHVRRISEMLHSDNTEEEASQQESPES